MDTTGIGLVGFGYWGANLARNVTEARGLDLRAVADRRPWRLERVAEDYPQVEVFADVERMLDVAGIDAVIVATPAASHVALGLQVLESGRHVLIEKPLSLDVEGGSRLVAEAERRRRVAMVGHTFVYSPAVERLRQLIGSGVLGSVRFAESRRLLGQARVDCDVLWDLGAHDVSILLRVFGEEPAEVRALGHRHMTTAHADTCYVNLRFSSGMDANLHLSWVNPFKVRLLTLVGSKQMAVFDDVPLDQKVTVYGAGIDDAEALLAAEAAGEPEETLPFARLDVRTSAGDKFIPGLAATEPLLREVEDFSRACATGEEPVSSARFGLDVVRILTSVEESMRRNGAAVEVPPRSETP